MATLITGLGYIGSALAARLLEQGEEVVAIENFFSTPRGPLVRLGERGRLRLIEGDVSDPAVVERALGSAEVEVVYHTAAQASTHPKAAPIAYTQETNFTGPRVLLDACAEHGRPRVVLASSMRIYRAPLPRRVTERAPLGPTDLVHLSHLYAELLLEAYRAAGRLKGTAGRLGIVHGVSPVMKSDSRFLAAPQRFCLQAAASEPLVVEPIASGPLAFVHLEDAVEGLVRCASPGLAPWAANVAAEARTVLDLARLVRAAAQQRGIEVEIRSAGRPRRYAPRSIVSALDSTGFVPARRLEDSVGDVLDCYLAMGIPACASW